jgi:hypothetical protein
MDQSSMLHSMCSELLSNTDIKAISKNREFTDKEAGTIALFENFFLSSKGLENAFSLLSPDEVIVLHFLSHTGKTVDITFFDRIYGSETTKSSRYGTITQRYKGVFDKVKSSLIRRGVLLIAEEKRAWQSKTKMERWRFKFPEEFKQLLPSLFKSVKSYTGKGDSKKDIFRQVLKGIVQNKEFNPDDFRQDYKLSFVKDELLMGGKMFTANSVHQWQLSCWKKSLPFDSSVLSEEKNYVPSLKTAQYAFSLLTPHEWITPEQLTAVLKIFSGENHINADTLCYAGWKWGFLAKYHQNNITYYAPVSNEQSDELSITPDQYLSFTSESAIIIDEEKIPYDSLECLVHISNLTIENSHFVAKPHLIRMGNAFQEIQNQPLVTWLKDNSSVYNDVFKKVEKRWGKQIIHENILIAKVDDLTLKVNIEKSFKSHNDVVFLSHNFMVFPKKLLPEIEKKVLKSGHVIKSVSLKVNEKN